MREREGEEVGKVLNGDRKERGMVMKRKIKRKAEKENEYRRGKGRGGKEREEEGREEGVGGIRRRREKNVKARGKKGEKIGGNCNGGNRGEVGFHRKRRRMGNE